jgi:hypothetical protein
MDESKRRLWSTPKLTVHGTVESLTRQTKYKTVGSGDDVILEIPNAPSLSSTTP